MKSNTSVFLIAHCHEGRGNSTVVSVSVCQTGRPGSRPARSFCFRKVEFYQCAIDLFPPVPMTSSKKAVHVSSCLCDDACKRPVAISLQTKKQTVTPQGATFHISVTWTSKSSNIINCSTFKGVTHTTSHIRHSTISILFWRQASSYRYVTCYNVWFTFLSTFLFIYIAAYRLCWDDSFNV